MKLAGSDNKDSLEQLVFDKRRERRRTYYRVTYLNSDDWKRKRALVLKRDRYRCAVLDLVFFGISP